MKLFTSPHTATRESTIPTVRHLQIFVLFNGPDTTANALRSAARFASDLGGDIVIAAPLIVPYPLPLDCPSSNKRSLLAQIQRSVSQSAIKCSVHKVIVAYARDRRDGWLALLPPHCIVMLGKPGRLSLLPRLRTWLAARSLRGLGHEVVVA